MKTKNPFYRSVFLLSVIFIIQSFSHLNAKSYQVAFHEKANNLVIALDQTPEGFFENFYLIKLISPLNKELFTDGKYKISVKKEVLILSGKKKTLVLTTSKKVIQTAFRQRGVYYILVNAIASGVASEPILAEDVFYQEITNKPFEKEEPEADLGQFKIQILYRNKNYFENLDLGYF